MNEKKKQILRYINNYRKLMGFDNVKTENGISTIKGKLIGRVVAPERNGHGFVMQVSGRTDTDFVKVLVETSDALPFEVFDFEEITVKGKVADNILIADRPYVFMIAESVTASGNIFKGTLEGLENIDITISNQRKYALAPIEEEDEDMATLMEFMFSKMDADGLLSFTIKNGKLAMHGKGEFKAKDIMRIANKLLGLIENNNPDYTWHFE